MKKQITNKLTFEDLTSQIQFWANKRDILAKDNAPKQFMKFIEESGELSSAILKNNQPEVVDSFGDVLVTLIILAEQLNYDLVDCLNHAYDEIKDREGKTVDGVFIKND
jgi:NTP pyrophosphatase (non-canonical NTP hydrolase)